MKKGGKRKKSADTQQSKKLKQSILFQKEPEFGDGLFNNSEIHITSWNINGIRACIKKTSFEQFVARQEIDILCLNETKLQEQMVPEFKKKFPQFPYEYWNCSRVKKGYSGVAILSKTNPISVKNGINKTEHEGEGRVITAEFSTFFLVATYIPNAGQGLKRLDYRTKNWDKDFHAYLKSLENEGKGVVWMGDLNVVHEDIDIYTMNGKEKFAGCTPEERKNFGESLRDGFVDSFRYLYPDMRKYSWYSEKNPRARVENWGWRLDYIVLSQSLVPRLSDSLIYDDVMGSDHHPIEIILINQ